ncbi:MAG: hypothetical protein WDZ90_00310 [Candidatus Paceibacterota bacterium]
MYKIVCRELTGEECAFVAQGATKEEVKENFYAHGAESSIHKEWYHSASKEEASAFSEKIDELLNN